MSDPLLAEILAELALPPRALRRWLADVDDFCARHGGDRRYRRLRALVAACRAVAERPR